MEIINIHLSFSFLFGGGGCVAFRSQEAFSHLLGEQNELVQELASQGMSLVYELGDDLMKKSLVNALVGTLTGSGKRKRAVKVNMLCIFLFHQDFRCRCWTKINFYIYSPGRNL